MRIKTKHLITLLVLLLVFTVKVKAQDNSTKEPLSVIIITLQDQYKVQFNYAEDIVSGILIEAPKSNLSLNEVIDYLNEVSGLSFSLFNNIVLVQKKGAIVLCGYIKDRDNNLPLESATIQTKSKSTTSDASGFFQIELAEESEQITIRHLGYITITEAITFFDTSSCLDIFLNPSFEPLSEVVISNYIVDGIDKVGDGSYQINFSEIYILP